MERAGLTAVERSRRVGVPPSADAFVGRDIKLWRWVSTGGGGPASVFCRGDDVLSPYGRHGTRKPGD